MADELVENAEFGRKRKNEEDPILIAQRFLNIYRQMHIFNKQKQDEFDDMLLNLSPDVQILLGTLPGGSLLIGHIDELKHKRGLVSAPIKKTNSFQKKISKNSPLSESDSSGDSKGGNVIIDASFASELSSSLSMALQQAEKRYKEDIRTLTETIMTSQATMAQMMKDILIAFGNNMKPDNNYSVLHLPETYPVANNAKPDFKTEKIRKNEKILESGDFATPENSPNTDNLSVSSLAQKETDLPESDVLQTLSPDFSESPIENTAEFQEPEITEAEKNAVDTSLESTQKTEDDALDFKKINSLAKDLNNRFNTSKKNKNKKKNIISEATLADDAKTILQDAFDQNEGDANQQLEHQMLNTDFGINDILSKDNDSDNDVLNINLDAPEKENEQETPLSAGMAQIRNALIDNEAEEKTTLTDFQKKGSKKNLPDQSPNPLSELPENAAASDALGDTPVFLDELNDTPVFLDELDNTPVSLDELNDTPVSLDELDNTPVSLDENSYTTIALEEEDKTSKEAETFSQNDGDWEWEYVDDGTTENNGDWEWEYVDDGTTENNGDWEWEYVDDSATENDGDWEWEYIDDEATGNGNKS